VGLLERSGKKKWAGRGYPRKTILLLKPGRNIDKNETGGDKKNSFDS